MPRGLLIQPNGDYELRDINGLDDIRAAIGDEDLDWADVGPLTYICYGQALFERAFNAVATTLYHQTHPDIDDPLCGPVLVMGPPVDENESDIPDKYFRQVKQLVADNGPQIRHLAVPLSPKEQMDLMHKTIVAQNKAQRALREGHTVDFGGIQIGPGKPLEPEIPWEGNRRTGALKNLS
jgi:hypothetical protein